MSTQKDNLEKALFPKDSLNANEKQPDTTFQDLPKNGAVVVVDMSAVEKPAQEITGKDVEEFLRTATFKSYSDITLVSDNYHSFDELYECRHALFIALCNCNKNIAWKSKVHSDGTTREGWFLLGLRKNPTKQITFHLPGRLWDSCLVEELEMAPEFDGHTTVDVIERLYTIK